MKAKEVLKKLNIARQTLTRYVSDKKIRVEELDNGKYEYNDEDIYSILTNNNRFNCIYSKESINDINYKSYTDFYLMLDDLLNYNIRQLIINGEDINDKNLLQYLCNKFGCELIIK